MGTGSVGGMNPFEGALWDKAQVQIAKSPKGLSDEQLLGLVREATADNVVTPKEQELLTIVADPANVQKIAAAMVGRTRTTGLTVNGLDLQSARGKQIAVNIPVGLAGQQLKASYDPTAEARRASIQAKAAATKVGPTYGLNMATRAGRDALLDTYGQLMGTPIYGSQACGAASLLALAINAGPGALGALARTVRNDHAYDPTWAPLCDRFAKPDATFTLQDLAALQDALLDRMLTEQTQREAANGTTDGVPDGGLSPETLTAFIDAHQKDLAPLFAGGGSILPVDNSGDGAMDHYVAYVPNGGKDRVFEPWETSSGHHLITDPLALRRYVQAMQP